MRKLEKNVAELVVLQVERELSPELVSSAKTRDEDNIIRPVNTDGSLSQVHASIEVLRWRCVCKGCYNTTSEQFDKNLDTCNIDNCDYRADPATPYVFTNVLMYWEFRAEVPRSENTTLTNANKADTIDKIMNLYKNHQVEPTHPSICRVRFVLKLLKCS